MSVNFKKEELIRKIQDAKIQKSRSAIDYID